MSWLEDWTNGNPPTEALGTTHLRFWGDVHDNTHPWKQGICLAWTSHRTPWRIHGTGMNFMVHGGEYTSPMTFWQNKQQKPLKKVTEGKGAPQKGRKGSSFHVSIVAYRGELLIFGGVYFVGLTAKNAVCVQGCFPSQPVPEWPKESSTANVWFCFVDLPNRL